MAALWLVGFVLIKREKPSHTLRHAQGRQVSHQVRRKGIKLIGFNGFNPDLPCVPCASSESRLGVTNEREKYIKKE